MLSSYVLADRLRVNIGRLARKLRQHSLQGLTPSQTSVLATLDRHGPMNMSMLAQREGISKPSATGIVGRLIQKDLIARGSDPDDRRSVIISISQDGKSILEKKGLEPTMYLARRIDDLEDHDRAVLERAVWILEDIGRW